MPASRTNQREIAKALGVTQATVSLALRGDPSISAAMRKKVSDTAERMGYRPNAYVNMLMSHVRAGKPLSQQGVVGMLVETASLKDWHQVDSYRVFHEGVLKRGGELGYRVEPFFLQSKGMNPARLDRILQARGIRGLILAPPYHGNRSLKMEWNRYAAVGVGFGWEEQELNRVVFDNLQNYITAFHALRDLGYRRIGTVLGETFTYGNRFGTKWYTGYLECQDGIPAEERIPVFAGKNQPGANQVPVFAGASGPPPLKDFQAWIRSWQPDALLTLTGRERDWLRQMGTRVPEDMGLACLSQPFQDGFARVGEKADIVGGAAVELVVAQLNRNEFGPPVHPAVTMIEGRWIPGETAPGRD